jgi:hypothetical protein
VGVRNPICKSRMDMKSRHLPGSLVTAVIAKITNHLEVCVGNMSTGTRLLRLVGSPSLQAVQEVGAYRTSNARSVKLTPNQMRFKNGPPLPLGGQLRWPLQLRPFHKVSLSCRYCLFLSPHYGLPSHMGCCQFTTLGWWTRATIQHEYNLTDSLCIL